jgi:hypothetical protein
MRKPILFVTVLLAMIFIIGYSIVVKAEDGIPPYAAVAGYAITGATGASGLSGLSGISGATGQAKAILIKGTDIPSSIGLLGISGVGANIKCYISSGTANTGDYIPLN